MAKRFVYLLVLLLVGCNLAPESQQSPTQNALLTQIAAETPAPNDANRPPTNDPNDGIPPNNANGQRPNNPDTPPPGVPRDWVAYHNIVDHYTFWHPADMTPVEDSNAHLVTIADQIQVNVWDSNPEEARGDSMMITKAEDAQIGPYAARRLTGGFGSVGGNIPQSAEMIVIPQGGRYYVLTVYELKRSQTTGDPTRALGDIPDEAMRLFNGLLASFHIDE